MQPIVDYILHGRPNGPAKPTGHAPPFWLRHHAPTEHSLPFWLRHRTPAIPREIDDAIRRHVDQQLKEALRRGGNGNFTIRL